MCTSFAQQRRRPVRCSVSCCTVYLAFSFFLCVVTGVSLFLLYFFYVVLLCREEFERLCACWLRDSFSPLLTADSDAPRSVHHYAHIHDESTEKVKRGSCLLRWKEGEETDKYENFSPLLCLRPSNRFSRTHAHTVAFSRTYSASRASCCFRLFVFFRLCLFPPPLPHCVLLRS